MPPPHTTHTHTQQIMQDHGVLSLEGVRKGQAAVALATAIQQRGVMECDSKRMELDLSITTLVCMYIHTHHTDTYTHTQTHSLGPPPTSHS